MDITGLGSVFSFAESVIGKIWPPKADPNEKLKAQAVLAKMVEERETSIVEAKKDIIVAEMQQGDEFTKRARPMIVYCGLFFIFLVHVALPFIAFFSGRPMPELKLPQEFWWAWGGVCSIWVIGRSAEKAKAGGKLVDMIVGK